MKLLLIISFIFFSVFSAIAESQNIELCAQGDCISSEGHPDSDAHSDSGCQHHCQDSNCYGSAHFGHGFYYLKDPYSILSGSSDYLLKVSFLDSSHHSQVFLDSIFRPPLPIHS